MWLMNTSFTQTQAIRKAETDSEKIEIYEIVLQSFDDQLTRLQGLFEDAEADGTRMANEIEQLEDRISDFQSRESDMSDELDRLQSRIDELENELAELAAKLQGLSNENE